MKEQFDYSNSLSHTMERLPDRLKTIVIVILLDRKDVKSVRSSYNGISYGVRDVDLDKE